MIPLLAGYSYNIDVVGTLCRLFFELGSTALLMFYFRPREWPEYFNLNIYDVPLLGLANLNPLIDSDRILPNVVVPLYFAKIKEYQRGQSFSGPSDYSFNSGHQVLICNPVFDSF